MARKTLISVSVAGLLAISLPWQAYSLGLGEITLNSALNQPLQAEIKLHAVHEVPLGDIRVSLASREEFARAGVEPALVLGNFRFRLERKESGATVVAVTSQGSIRDPVLEFLVTVTWPQGRLSRAYTLLLDPPSLPTETDPLLRETRAVSAPFSIAEPMLLDEGATMATEMLPPSQSEQQKRAASPVTDKAPRIYGPITPADTLWPLAQRLRPQPSILPQQMMLALLRANPDAFLHHNLNGLIVGRMLQIPSEEEVLKISQEEAIREVQGQNEAWKKLLERRKAAKGETQATKIGDQEGKIVLEDRVSEENKTEVAVGQSHLQEEAVSAIKMLDGERVDLKQLLALAHAALEIRTQESEMLQSRLQKLEQKIGALQERALKKSSSPVPSSEHLAVAKEEEDVLSQQRLVLPAGEEALISAAKQPKVASGPGEKALVANAGEGERSKQRKISGVFIELKESLLWGGGGLLLLTLMLLQVRKRKAREEPMLLSVAGPGQGVGVEVPAEVLNVIPLVLQPEGPEIEAGEITNEAVFSLEKPVDDSPAGNGLLRQEAETRTAAEAVIEFPHAESEAAERLGPEAMPVGLEFDLGEITSFGQNSVTEESPSDSPAAVSDEEQEDGLEFDLGEFSLEESTPEMLQPEAESEECEDRGVIVPFSLSDFTAGEGLELESFGEKEAGIESETMAEEIVDADQTSDTDDYRPLIESSGHALMNDLDEMEVKLNLAQEYLEMGSAQEARDILEEVVSAGDQRQRGMGQALLSKLSQAS